MVEMSKAARKAHNIFSWLKMNFPNADVCTLRYISVYIARTNDEFDVEKDLQIKSSRFVCELLINNGSKIEFVANSDDPLTFVVNNEDGDVYMTLYVAKHEPYNLSTAFAHGTVGSGDWEYKIGTDDFDERDIAFIRVYYKGKLIEDGTSYFKLSTDDDIDLGYIDGLGHLTDIMIRVNLLYNNLRSMRDNKLVRKKRI